MPKMILDWKTLTEFITDAFAGVGVPREEAAICTDVYGEGQVLGTATISLDNTGDVKDGGIKRSMITAGRAEGSGRTGVQGVRYQGLSSLIHHSE